MGLGDYLNVRPGELSGGEQQRVALGASARVGAAHSADGRAAFSSDHALNEKLRSEILRLHGELGFTLVYVTHNRDEARELGTRIVHFRQGRIV